MTGVAVALHQTNLACVGLSSALAFFLAAQLAEPLHITDFQSRIFGPPLIKGSVRDAVLATELLDPGARLGILEHRNDLFLRVPFPCHGPLL